MTIIAYRKYFFALSALAVALSIGAIVVFGLRPGIDLAGGSLLEVSYPGDRPSVDTVREVVAPLALGEVRVQPAGDDAYVLRQRDLAPEERNALLEALGTLGEAREEQFTSVGPSIGAELLRKAWVAVALVAITMILFIAFAFRQVSEPVSSWKYGVIAVIALLHDILIPMGLFAFLGHAAGAEVDSLFIVALLTILGVSVNDTIVIFDRIRENLRRNENDRRHEDFEGVVGRSVSQTIARSINTSLTLILVLVALYVLGPVATKNFTLTLIVGMIAGTYSSIFLASPLLVVIEKRQRKKAGRV